MAEEPPASSRRTPVQVEQPSHRGQSRVVLCSNHDAREGIHTGIRDGYAPDTHRYATDTHGYANGYAQDTQDT
eukprot:6880787-Prymnesium_polylepis.1